MSAQIPSSSNATLLRQLARDADLCVKCGLCLNHCPTYNVTRDEAESPRGRIALAQGLANGMIGVDARVEKHLDGCLTCRACEAVCPANVPYGDLIDGAREYLARERPERTRLARVMGFFLENRAWTKILAAALIVYQRSGLQWLLRTSGALRLFGLARLDSTLPRVHWPSLPADSPAPGGETVALFTNCTSPLTEPAALAAAIKLLLALGCDVRVPATQGCCGAIAQHAGLRERAAKCAQANRAAFAGESPVLGIASGCTAQLMDYDTLLGSETGRPFVQRVDDVLAFIAAHPRLGALAFKPVHARAVLHTPCTMKNVVKADAAVVKLLERLPGLVLERLDSACCGAAGTYFISQPEMADTLAAKKVAQIRNAQPVVVLSSNVGCSMHLAAALRREGLSVTVRHPLELLAESLA